MDGRQDQIVFVEQRDASLIAGWVGWIQCEFGQETLARWIATGDLLEPDEIGASNVGVFLDAVEMWFDPMATPNTGGFRLRL
jgi:hypothetical protein